MKIIYTFILLLCALVAKAEVSVSDSMTCAPVSILLSSDSANLQKAQGNEYKKSVYWKKHKHYKVAAFCTLGVGLFGTLIGTGFLCSDTTPDWEEIKGSLGVVFTAGGVAISAASIPLFVAAHKNKKKAMNGVSLSLNCSKVSVPLANGVKQTNTLLGACLNF